MVRHTPLQSLEEWDDFKELESKFNPVDPTKKKEEFRNYASNPRMQRVRKFYMENHTKQTVAFVQGMEKKYSTLGRKEMGIWEALEFLNSYVDDSDPDTNLPQIQHALQTAEAIRAEFPGEEYDWFHLTGLIHDLGKFLGAVYDEEQWCVVGDTFPVGCKFSDKIVFHEFFKHNPDSKKAQLQSECGVYKKGCGLKNVHMSWGHDEYMYRVCVENKCTLPQKALYVLRYHSFYPWHKEGEYMHLCDKDDLANLKWVKEFNRFDLYSKANEVQDVAKLKPYYQSLIAKYFPKKLKW